MERGKDADADDARYISASDYSEGFNDRISELHDQVHRLAVLANALPSSRGQSKRAAMLAVTNAEQALLWLGHSNSIWRNGN